MIIVPLERTLMTRTGGDTARKGKREHRKAPESEGVGADGPEGGACERRAANASGHEWLERHLSFFRATLERRGGRGVQVFL